MTERSVADKVTAVNEAEQDRSMVRLAEILRENGIEVLEASEAGEIGCFRIL